MAERSFPTPAELEIRKRADRVARRALKASLPAGAVDAAVSGKAARDVVLALASAGLLAEPSITDRFEDLIEGDTEGLFTEPADEDDRHDGGERG